MSEKTEIERLDELVRKSEGVRSGAGSYMAAAALLRRLWPEIKAVIRVAECYQPDCAEVDDLNTAIRRELGEPEGER